MTNLNNKAKPKSILVAVVKYRQRAIPPVPSKPPPPPPPRGTAEHLPALSVLGWGICKFCTARGGGAFANPGAIPELLTRGFLSEYNYTEGFTGKKADWLICQGQE